MQSNCKPKLWPHPPLHHTLPSKTNRPASTTIDMLAPTHAHSLNTHMRYLTKFPPLKPVPDQTNVSSVSALWAQLQPHSLYVPSYEPIISFENSADQTSQITSLMSTIHLHTSASLSLNSNKGNRWAPTSTACSTRATVTNHTSSQPYQLIHLAPLN